MDIFLSRSVFAEFQSVCYANGFVRRGNAFFCVWGDGVLQVLKFQRERIRSDYHLDIGLFSMYGDLLKEWFTSSGCIPRYCVSNLLGIRFDTHVIPPKEQLGILIENGFEWLDGIKTQKQLAYSICKLDQTGGADIVWNDGLKFEPFLSAGDYERASDVIKAILDQHRFSLEFNVTRMEPGQRRKDEERLRLENELLDRKFQMAQRADSAEVSAYLKANYVRNSDYAKFCMPR